jgi:hypothetical protein
LIKLQHLSRKKRIFANNLAAFLFLPRQLLAVIEPTLKIKTLHKMTLPILYYTIG